MFFLNVMIAMLPLFSATANTTVPADVEEYCNERFAYCVSYPGGFFEDKQYADNGDGITMYAADGRIEADIMGAYNVLGWSLEEIFENYFKAMREKPMEVELLELYTDESYGWAKMSYNYEIQLVRVNLLHDAYITTIITVPASSPDLLDELEQSVQVTFPI